VMYSLIKSEWLPVKLALTKKLNEAH